jgi:PAS domain S-box-containing protein
VIMDIVLKGKLDGIEAAERIRASVDASLVFLTAYPQEDLFNRAKVAAPDAFLTKPVSVPELHRAVELAINRNKARRQQGGPSAGEVKDASLTPILGVWLLDELRNTAHVTSYVSESLGYSSEDMVGKPFLDFVPEHARPHVVAVLGQCSRQGPTSAELKLHLRSGSDISVSAVIAPVFDPGGRSTGVLVAIHRGSPGDEAKSAPAGGTTPDAEVSAPPESLPPGTQMIPQADPGPAPAAAPCAGLTLVIGAPRILVVEDKMLSAKHLQQTLTGFGYEVVGMAAEGTEAVAEAQDTRPDLVLMDIMLEGDSDGIEAARRIRERLDIPVIYLTAYTDERPIRRARETQPFGYLLKPVRPEELRTTVEMALYTHKVNKLARRELERMVAKGRSSSVIATSNLPRR